MTTMPMPVPPATKPRIVLVMQNARPGSAGEADGHLGFIKK
jgi:hypothetical protein